MIDYRLTTLDNPYNPFTEYDNWYAFDEEHGYCTSGYIDRVGMIDLDMPEAIFNETYDRAVDEIAKFNLLGIYKKVSAEDYKDNKWKPIKIDDILAKTVE